MAPPTSHDFAKGSTLSRVLEPEVMDDPLEARDYDLMNHGEVNGRFVSDLLALPADVSRTLDVGTGTAQIPIELCRQNASARVLGVDLAFHMLRVGVARVERAGLAGVVALEPRDAKALGIADGSFTCVMSNSLMHHLGDPGSVFEEMARVLAPAGWLFVRDLLRPDDDAQVERLVALYAAGENERQRALLDASLRAALSLSELAEMTRRAGIGGDVIRKTSDRHWTLAWQKR
jgi:ubiquinone/menaquinone biosynthesis C-methylase UbiE